MLAEVDDCTEVDITNKAKHVVPLDSEGCPRFPAFEDETPVDEIRELLAAYFGALWGVYCFNLRLSFLTSL